MISVICQVLRKHWNNYCKQRRPTILPVLTWMRLLRLSHNLAVIYRDMGQVQDAIAAWKLVFKGT